MNKKRKRGWDEAESVIGRNASLGGGWHIPRIPRRITTANVFVLYITRREIGESIHFGKISINIYKKMLVINY